MKNKRRQRRPPTTDGRRHQLKMSTDSGLTHRLDITPFRTQIVSQHGEKSSFSTWTSADKIRQRLELLAVHRKGSKTEPVVPAAVITTIYIYIYI